jgi:glycosyltransferase involved in cell wall biosynthesis
LNLGGFAPARAALRAAWQTYTAEAPLASRGSRRPPPPVAPATNIRPLGVLIATHNLNLEGAPWFVYEYACHLAAQPGWRVRVISSTDGPLREKFTAAGLAVEVLDLQSALAAGTPEEFDRTLVALAARPDWADIDLVVANTMVSFWAVHLARRAGKPALLYIHESAPVRRFFAPLLAPALLPLVEAAFGLARRVVFIAAASQPVYARLERHGNFRYLPSWIDVASIRRFAAAHDAAELRRRHNLPRDAVVFANVGSVCERKGQHVFVRAIARLHEELAAAGQPVPTLQFLMIGARPGPYLDALRHDIARLRLSNVIIIDEVPSTYEYYRLADLFVCSSFEEAFPRVLLEAAAFSLPIVSTNVNGITDMLAPDEAWLVPPGDAGALAGAMREALAAHLAGDRTRARRAHDTVAARFAAEQSLPLHLAMATEAATPPN